VKLGDRVKLKQFDGSESAPNDLSEHENFWTLLGQYGEIVEISDPNPSGNRVLVKFDRNPSEFGLECHNDIGKSLWIDPADLEIEGNK